MSDFKLSKEELFEKYNTSDDGLNEKEAKQRLAIYGYCFRFRLFCL